MSSPTQLVRSLGLFSATLLVISSIIGSGVFKKVAPMADLLQAPGWVLLAWLLAGLISLFGALSNAEVAGLLADSGGEYAYFRQIYNRFFAFLYGWACFAVIRSASIASLAYVFAQSFDSLFPLPGLPHQLASASVLGISLLQNLGVKGVAILLIWLLTLLNSRGIQTGKQLSNGITLLVGGIMLAIVLSGLILGGGSLTQVQAPEGYVTPSLSVFIQALFGALLSAFWAYEGWASVGYVGGEIKDPKRNLPLALSAGVLMVMGIYLAVNFTYLYVLPIGELRDLYHSQNSIAAVAVVSRFAGNAGQVLIALAILIATLGCTHSTLLMSSRLYYKMATDGFFFSQAAFVHPRFRVPDKAMRFQATWASVLVLSGTFDQLTDMLIFTSFVFYGATTLGLFVLRRRMPEAHRPYKVIAYPLVPLLFLLFCGGLLLNTLLNKTGEALTGLALVATGIPFYLYWTSRQQVC
jgi:APA family basic amino acid/polyamine antiporter